MTLKRKYPEYFNLDTSKGLAVYIWQMGPNSYSCTLQENNLKISQEIMLSLRSATMEEMRVIVQSYNLPKEDIIISPYAHPLSSYAYNIDQAYEEMLNELFWGTE